MTNINGINKDLSLGKMLKKTYIFSILTASTLGMLPLAALGTPEPCCQPRGGDNAIVQTSTQQANVSGKGNAVSQNANQLVNTTSNTTVRPTARTAARRTTPVRARRHVQRPAVRPVQRPATVPCKTI